MRRIEARAPGKAILFGEHAINRGQPALAVSVGLFATCRLAEGDGIVLRSDAPGHERQSVARDDVLRLGREVDGWRDAGDYESIRRLAAADFFAPAKYVLASALGEALPEGLEVAFESELPQSSGLGSGGAAFAALATALAAWTGVADRERIADWAHRGDILSHGGVASRLDTQTALCGGAIRFLAGQLGEPLEVHPDLPLVIANTGVVAATSEVNARVRRWLDESPAGRMRYFEGIGLLARTALEPLRRGDWPELGRLMTLNQVVLEKVGVSSPEIERLVDAALGAGALGAKLSGSGGGGIVIALAEPERAATVAAAIDRAGGAPLQPPLAVPGATIVSAVEDS